MRGIVFGGYTSNLMKGGALLQECVQLIRKWEPGEPFSRFGQRVISDNVLAKSTRNRGRDIVGRVFRRRFLTPTDEPARVLKILIDGGASWDTVVVLMYYWTALGEQLLFDFVIERLWEFWAKGRAYVSTQDVVDYLHDLMAQGRMGRSWSQNIRLKTARGLLAALRDYGVLEGGRRKRIRGVRPSWGAAAIIAHDLHARGLPPAEVLASAAWRLFLVGETQLQHALREAQERGVLAIQQAGSVVRIDWAHGCVEEVAHVIASGAVQVSGRTSSIPQAAERLP